ncbi:MAG: hypothetical protein JSS42_16030 [Proteobacteria bacterium]|uniref:hypothetical protein n=1 Tax=Rudaea sp. TaxID=2136325 RepID=UPI00321FF9F8|nr:hypothetical protein [Pseudomonadota bacterium]
MTTTTKVLLICSLACACALALLPRAAAARDDGSRQGDESLSCDEIYAQGMAISQKEQQQRDAANGKMGAQTKATAALIGAAIIVPTPATGMAAQAAAESTMKSQVDLGAQAGAARPDARKERLRALWTQKHCVKN